METTDLKIKAKKISQLSDFNLTIEDYDKSYVIIGYRNGDVGGNYKLSLANLFENINVNGNIDNETLKEKILQLIENGELSFDTIGPQGKMGHQGPKGSQGNIGPQGKQGAQGKTGAQGEKGQQGNRGYQGFEGPQGKQGQQGSIGKQGIQGKIGLKGDQGYQGKEGKQGPRGKAGLSGGIGAQGKTGAQGDVGKQGPQGAKGDSGIVDPSLLNNLATKEFVNGKISDLINGAPEALDTLKEISDALKNDPDVINALFEKIDGLQSLIENNPPTPTYTTYTITCNLTNIIQDENNDSIILSGGSTTLKFIPADGYELPNEINVVGSLYTYDQSLGTLNLFNPSQNIIITMRGTESDDVTYYFDFAADTDENGILTYDENGHPNGIKPNAEFKYSSLNKCPINYKIDYDFSEFENWYGVGDSVWIVIPSKYLKSANGILLDDNNNEYQITTGTGRYALPFDEIYNGTYKDMRYLICLISNDGLSDIISFTKIN